MQARSAYYPQFGVDRGQPSPSGGGASSARTGDPSMTSIKAFGSEPALFDFGKTPPRSVRSLEAQAAQGDLGNVTDQSCSRRPGLLRSPVGRTEP
jgi:hypothetical protein